MLVSGEKNAQLAWENFVNRIAGETYASLSLRLRLGRRELESSITDLLSSLLSSIALRNCSSSSYAASRLFMVERRFVLDILVPLRVFFSFVFRELSLEDALDAGGEGEPTTGRYRDDF